jgi:ubiquitin
MKLYGRDNWDLTRSQIQILNIIAQNENEDCSEAIDAVMSAKSYEAGSYNRSVFAGYINCEKVGQRISYSLTFTGQIVLAANLHLLDK